MVIRGEPDQASASLGDWVTYRDHLKSLPEKDASVSLALAVANARIQKLQQSGDRPVNA
jgi:hypothetical protein